MLPSNFIFSDALSENGASATGNCSDLETAYTNVPELSRCNSPGTSVLFDGNTTPTLTGLDGDMWASQLLVLRVNTGNEESLVVDFLTNTRVEGIELVMFNCPDRDTEIQTVIVESSTSTLGMKQPLDNIQVSSTSCNSLVRVCSMRINAFHPILFLRFGPATGSNRVYLAEVRLFSSFDNFDCTPGPITTSPPPTTTATTTTATTSTSGMEISSHWICFMLLLFSIIRL